MHKHLLVKILSIVIFAAGCTGVGGLSGATSPIAVPASGTSTPTTTPLPSATVVQETPTSLTTEVAADCNPAPITVPTEAAYPGSNQLDKSTNLHVTGHAVRIDLASYRLRVTGKVASPLSLSYDALRCMPKVSKTLHLICPGFFDDQTSWSGVPLKYILDLAEVQSGASAITLVAGDGYRLDVNIITAMKEGNFLAYEWEGEPLPILHGFPLRAVFPGLQGSMWVKWLAEIVVK